MYILIENTEDLSAKRFSIFHISFHPMPEQAGTISLHFWLFLVTKFQEKSILYFILIMDANHTDGGIVIALLIPHGYGNYLRLNHHSLILRSIHFPDSN